MKFNFTIPEVDMKKSRQTAVEANNLGGKLCASAKLSCYKMETICGNKLPEYLRQEVTQHVKMMRKKGWLTARDEVWCKEHHIS